MRQHMMHVLLTECEATKNDDDDAQGHASYIRTYASHTTYVLLTECEATKNGDNDVFYSVIRHEMRSN
jgi:hypothetical protein